MCNSPIILVSTFKVHLGNVSLLSTSVPLYISKISVIIDARCFSADDFVRWKGPALRLFVWPAIHILMDWSSTALKTQFPTKIFGIGSILAPFSTKMTKMTSLHVQNRLLWGFFRGNPRGSFKLSFFASFMIWSPLSGDIPSIPSIRVKLNQSKFKCTLCYTYSSGTCFMQSRSTVLSCQHFQDAEKNVVMLLVSYDYALFTFQNGFVEQKLFSQHGMGPGNAACARRFSKSTHAF